MTDAISPVVDRLVAIIEGLDAIGTVLAYNPRDRQDIAKHVVSEIDGITLVTPLDPEISAGIVCVDVRDVSPESAVTQLRELGVVASATPYRQSYLRLGPSIVTSPEEVDMAVDAVAQLVRPAS